MLKITKIEEPTMPVASLHQARLRPARSPILTAPRCGQDRERPRLKPTIEVCQTAIAWCSCAPATATVTSRWRATPPCSSSCSRSSTARAGAPRSWRRCARVPPRRSAPPISTRRIDGDDRRRPRRGRARRTTSISTPAAWTATTASCATSATSPRPGEPRAAAQRRLEEATVAVPRHRRPRRPGRHDAHGLRHRHDRRRRPRRRRAHNLARQILYSQDDLGRLKVDAARERLGALNERTEFVGIPRRHDVGRRHRRGRRRRRPDFADRRDRLAGGGRSPTGSARPASRRASRT